MENLWILSNIREVRAQWPGRCPTTPTFMQYWIHRPQVTELLKTLYADSEARDSLARKELDENGGRPATSRGFFHSMRDAYMAIGPEFGFLLYNLARASQAKTIVEFGTSFGVSTIYLASAIRDNGGGRVITTEYEPAKAEMARKNLTDAGLEDIVEFRVGDARQTLSTSAETVDMLFLDGAKELYIEVLNLLEHRLRPGAVIASDNTDHDGMQAFLDYIRDPGNGYTSAAILTGGYRGKCHEVTIRN